MRLKSSGISCGIKQLIDIGYYSKDKTMKNTYDKVMAKTKDQYGYNCAMVVASLTTNQKAAIKLLTTNGFKKVGKAKRNPNSGNRIILLVKRIGRD